MPEDEDDQVERKKAALSFAFKMQEARRTRAILDLAKPHLVVPAGVFDRDPCLLNVANGTLDLKTGELRPHSREDLLRKVAPVAYDPDAKAPLFDRFMLDITGGDKAMSGCLLRLFGSALLGGGNKQEMAVFHGGGRNGKSTLTALMNDLLGDYAVQATDDLFVEVKNKGVSTDVARLVGARLVTASETKDGCRLDAAKIKRLLGGEKVAARFLYQKEFEFVPEFTPVVNTNHKPLFDGGDFGASRRLLLFPFDVRIPDDKVDEEMPVKLRREMPGVLARVVRGCLDYQDGGLRPPARVADATAEYRKEMDTLGLFIAERLVFGEGKVDGRALFSVYEAWCSENRFSPLNKVWFGRKFTSRMGTRPGVRSTQHDGYPVWIGFALRTVPLSF